MYETVAAHFKAIKEKYEMQPIKVKIKVKLPFQCSQKFDDPYNQAGPGYESINYLYKAKPREIDNPLNPGNLINAPETRSAPEQDTRVLMLHVTLKAADEHRQEFAPTGRRFA